ncbi:MAG: HIRAN domain-containing protein [Bacteroidaceae bacterium]|nr:HIRAN domain-containing protein [Bacteroidaceae bacterium]
MKAKKLFFMECHLAGRKYHDADEVWEELKVGTKLKLVRDADNRHDPDAVAVVYERACDDQRAECEEFLLGYIPCDENEQIALLFDAGWSEIFECRINKINPEAHPENQIRITIRVNRKE